MAAAPCTTAPASTAPAVAHLRAPVAGVADWALRDQHGQVVAEGLPLEERGGLANEHTGDHKGAERAFRRGIELDPNDAELHNALGWTLFQDGRTDEAVAEYQRALAADPGHAKAHNNLALALVELG